MVMPMLFLEKLKYLLMLTQLVLKQYLLLLDALDVLPLLQLIELVVYAFFPRQPNYKESLG
uniref:Uncharacterized protein n=1 Tax=Meloidogyne enterolobii TaxID=390850 RepID=A0A6V7UE41_MELEN|nr:unnamed protein product [Meloidogyne enterolobii]